VSLADIGRGVQALAEQIGHVGSRAVTIITDVGEDHHARAFVEQIRNRAHAIEQCEAGWAELGDLRGASYLAGPAKRSGSDAPSGRDWLRGLNWECPGCRRPPGEGLS
jgi:hypothetical protein